MVDLRVRLLLNFRVNGSHVQPRTFRARMTNACETSILYFINVDVGVFQTLARYLHSGDLDYKLMHTSSTGVQLYAPVQGMHTLYSIYIHTCTKANRMCTDVLRRS